MSAKTHQCMSVIFLLIAAVSVLACSSREGNQSEAFAAETQRSSSAPAAGGIQPCKILTAAQVTTVLPNHDDGMVTDSGDSIMKGVKSYGCSYVSKEANLMTVVVSVAENEERFSWIKPNEGSHKNDRKIDVGDRGWVRSAADKVEIEVAQGLTVVELKLSAPGAQGKSAQMVELARAVTRRFQK